ncbi:hypothetical protein RRG08_039847 [Elysia crispata]|uniref:Uncharacterized protein n=1 Tax=Elysia crispata TaxID=231223 RepID=A0AAE0ZVR6_9GAST|nr:hypothetical protein RRG08_039847 [Elysia crispata]
MPLLPGDKSHSRRLFPQSYHSPSCPLTSYLRSCRITRYLRSHIIYLLLKYLSDVSQTFCSAGFLLLSLTLTLAHFLY